jgi:hypothetical protein
LDGRELILHFYKEFKEHYKDITQTEILQKAQKERDCNDSASPSLLFFYRRIYNATE